MKRAREPCRPGLESPPMRTDPPWTETLRRPAAGDHIVHTWTDEDTLVEAVTEYARAGLRAGEAVLVVAMPGRAARVKRALYGTPGTLLFVDAGESLAGFMHGEMPDWDSFERTVGAAVADLRSRHPAVRVYGEMVDILWQRGQIDAAIRL